jgi:hypothetical protein
MCFPVTEIQINKTKVQLYSSIKELPIDQSKKMQAYLLQQMGIGSGVQDIDDRLERMTTFLSADKKAEAVEELKNLRFAIFSTVQEVRYDSLAFACLLHSIDGERVQDYSSDGLTAMITRLSGEGLSNEKVEDILAEVKKNLTPNENYIFQNSF